MPLWDGARSISQSSQTAKRTSRRSVHRHAAHHYDQFYGVGNCPGRAQHRWSRQCVAWLVAAQFAGYAAIYLVTSLRLSGALELFQWIPFAATAIVTALGAIAIP